jgi:hypothetical protein
MKPKRAKHPPIVLIEWRDSRGLNAGWSDLERTITTVADRDFDELLVSAGFLLRSTKRFVVIALSLDNGNSNVDHTMQIPRCCIVRTTVIKRKRGYVRLK